MSSSAPNKNPRTVIRLLQTVTLLRSMGQGAALAVTSLYLNELGWSGAAIGAVIAGAGIFRAVLSVLASEINALLGPKRYLLVYESLSLLAAILAAATSVSWLLAAAVIMAGLGSGHSGSGGPAAPIERAWLGAYARDKQRARELFGSNALFGYAGLGSGALLACLPALFYGTSEGTGSFRLIYVCTAILTVACLYCLFRLQGGARKPKPAAEPAEADSKRLGEAAAESGKPRREGSKLITLLSGIVIIVVLSGLLRSAGLRELSLFIPVLFFLLLLASVNYRLFRKPRTEREANGRTQEIKLMASVLGGVTATMTSTVSAYWFTVRYGVSPGMIGAVMGASFLSAALVSRLTSRGSSRTSALRTIIGLQSAAIVLLLVLPWVASFPPAAIIEICCTACCLGTRGSRTAVMMEDRGKAPRTLLARLNLLVVRLSAVTWPGVFVAFVARGHAVLPFCLAAVFQAIAAILFGFAYRREGRPDMAAPASPASSTIESASR
ncbi:MFS transporter [Paenibacillus sacheonensis]|uniref:MFS transporter n=1 Tax=Paenibacillus sacheonensis TaxID=742054 RepID=A0A7X4YLR4_9BACL|nr:MFS transporter [Paenibacillus sacheonensis]MBM7563873.1 MFS family permease [Paenibacillus sacheonensis]NBC67779.1 MFS transporter [Paenibacillus sacheonensis]